MKKYMFLVLLLLCAAVSASALAAEGSDSLFADSAILSVKAWGFVDLEGAKLSAIIVEYDEPVDRSSITMESYRITDYVTLLEQSSGFEAVIESDYDGIPGNEGQMTAVYVNDLPEPSEDKEKLSGKYVVIEVNTAYMLSSQNLVYTNSMIAGVTQIQPIRTESGKIIEAGEKEIGNYTETEQASAMGGSADRQRSAGKQNGRGGAQGGRTGSGGQVGSKVSRKAEKDKIILPEFGEGSGWTLNYIGDGAFQAVNCYSEYTGQYEDFELPYSIYIPPQEVLEANKGNISLLIHMEHAGSNDSDPMAAITSSRAAVKMASDEVQAEHPTIIVVPQVEESRRSTDDMVASSEVNTAVWELLDWLLDTYSEYIDTGRIYGTGQSMGGMTILNMAAQRDNFFAGIAVAGAQWSNNYNKDYQHNGSPARSPENDPISFSGNGVDPENFANWYYMISDDNILVQTCLGDEMATGEWRFAREYIEMAGGTIACAEWDPALSISEQNELGRSMLDRDTSAPGTGIAWCIFTQGSHMSTWKYAYQLDYPFEWLFSQTRQTAEERGKLEHLKNAWLGRDDAGNILPGSGTNGMNSAQFTTGGASSVFTENWTPESVESSNP